MTTTTPAPIRLLATDGETAIDLRSFGEGFAWPDFVRVRPVDHKRLSGRWVVEVVWTDGDVQPLADMANVDRADGMAAALFPTIADRYRGLSIPVFWGATLAILAAKVDAVGVAALAPLEVKMLGRYLDGF